MEQLRKGAWLAALGLIACGPDEPGGDGGGEGSLTNPSGIVVTDTDGTESGEDDDTGMVLDIGGENDTEPPDPTVGSGDCPGGGMEGEEHSLIWIANSPEGTVSKIDTRTGTELARYFSGPSQGTDDPSRTSVNLSGDVAVTNRAGSITKIASLDVNCIDQNGDGTIQTSSGPADVLPWGQDECVLWHLSLGGDGNNNHGPRPTAWDGGAGESGGACSAAPENLWVGYWDSLGNNGEFRRIDGDTGVVLDSVSVPAWNTNGTDYGPYGGAVDGGGNLWAIGLFETLIRIDAQTLAVQRWVMPTGASPYGIAIDADGNPWTAGWDGLITRFNPGSETFDVIPTPDTRRMRGLTIDREGIVWIAANEPCGAISVDTATLGIINGNIALPGCAEPVGVSIDVDGQAWLPDRGANLAFKLDPNTLTATTTTGLVAPYTYSDMTGAGLGLVVNPPAE